MKTDKIFPDNWKEVVRGKKVILYNTGVGSMLSGREKHIEKMKWVFSVFQEHPEVVLWWRPHPLELATVESMVPYLATEYAEMRKQYKDKNIGVLDESTDLHRAIAISDAYYGDWSSVVHLYEKTGKPILLGNDSVMECSQEIGFGVVDFAIIGEFMWFVSGTINSMFRMHLDSFVVDEMIELPGYKIFEPNAIRYIMNAENELLLIPGWGKSLIAYNTDSRTIRKIEVGKRTKYSKYSMVCYEKGTLYLVSSGNKELVGTLHIKDLDLRWKHGKNCDYLNMEIIKKDLMDSEDIQYTTARTVGDKKYMFSSIENLWKIIDTKSGKVDIKRMGVKENIRKRVCDKPLFDTCENISTEGYSIYAGELKHLYTLPKYIDALINYNVYMENKDISLCGKKIYHAVIQDNLKE